jgi:hypothetical protein
VEDAYIRADDFSNSKNIAITVLSFFFSFFFLSFFLSFFLYGSTALWTLAAFSVS